jgi:hypothetical protein
MLKGEAMRGKYHPLISKAFKATSRLQIGINYDSEENKILIWRIIKYINMKKGK